MSVATVFRVDIQAWRGSDNPAFPSAVWRGEGNILMDASGGFAQVQLLFQLAGNPLSSRLWGLEQMAARVGGVTTTVQGDLIIVNLGHLTPDRPLTSRVYNWEAVGSGNANITTGLRTRDASVPIFLGAPSAPGLTAGLTWNVPNSGVPGSLTVAAAGYIWEPVALNSPGGVQRPATSIFGS